MRKDGTEVGSGPILALFIVASVGIHALVIAVLVRWPERIVVVEPPGFQERIRLLAGKGEHVLWSILHKMDQRRDGAMSAIPPSEKERILREQGAARTARERPASLSVCPDDGLESVLRSCERLSTEIKRSYRLWHATDSILRVGASGPSRPGFHDAEVAARKAGEECRREILSFSSYKGDRKAHQHFAAVFGHVAECGRLLQWTAHERSGTVSEREGDTGSKPADAGPIPR